MTKTRNPFATLARQLRSQVILDKREKVREREDYRSYGVSRRGVI